VIYYVRMRRDILTADLVRLYKHKSIREISMMRTATGRPMSYGTVRNRLLAANVRLRPRGSGKNAEHTDSEPASGETHGT